MVRSEDVLRPNRAGWQMVSSEDVLRPDHAGWQWASCEVQMMIPSPA